MKQRITALDLQILVKEFQPLLGYRLQNIYNVLHSPKQFVLKFSVPDSKKLVIVEFGNRIHLTDYERNTEPTPLNFVTKLRKHLKTRRLSGIKQIGNDRILVLEFSDGLYYLVLEFFSAGNILLLDESKKILILQRVVDSKDDKFAVNETYTMFDDSLFKLETKPYEKHVFTEEQVSGWLQQEKQKYQDYQSKLQELTDTKAQTSKAKKSKIFSIHKLLFVNALYLSSELILRKLTESGIKSNLSCFEFDDPKALSEVVEVLNLCEDEYIHITQDEVIHGVIAMKKNPNVNEETPTNLLYLNDEFHPFKPVKDESQYKFETFEGYNNTLDKFFSTLESLKNEIRIENQKQLAIKRLEKAKNERAQQIESLENQKNLSIKKGDLIIIHADLVSSCVELIKSMLDRQMDWNDIEKFIDLQKTSDDVVANTIALPLNLLENKIKLSLPDTEVAQDHNESSDSVDSIISNSDSSSDSDSSDSESSDSDSDSDSDVEVKPKKKQAKKSTIPTVSVWIDISLSPYANATSYFETKKNAEVKQMKVEANTELALQNAERKIQQDLNKALKNESEALSKVREKYWFEKFFWFVTSDGYLCLSGRDDLQNDMIYYRYFNDDDFFVYSDIEGALKVFVKNHYKGETIPPSTIWQAGMFSLSASASWSNKSSSSAWYLSGPDVSKKDVDGSLLGAGKFNFKGKKEHMPPVQLAMGFGIYFVGDEETTKKARTKRETRQQEIGLQLSLDNKKQDIDQSVIREKILEQEKNQQEGEEPKTEEQSETKEEPENTVTESESDLGLQNLKIVNKRGKKAKMKRAQQKYADQDEEDKLLRMEALGTLKQVKQQEELRLLQEEQEQQSKSAKYENQEKVQQRKQKQDEKELRKYLLQEMSQSSNEIEYLSIFDSLITKPSSSDKIVDFVPVFGPWYSLQKFKYKVKILPGNNKKGKSMTEILTYFNGRKVDKNKEDDELDWPDEHELLKTSKANDLITLLTVSKLKVALPNGPTKDTKGSKKPAKPAKATKKKGKR